MSIHERKPAPTKLQRHLDLIAYLIGRRLPVPVDELMEKIPAYSAKYSSGSDTDRDSARRMFERDKDELRAAGIPIRTVRYEMRDIAEEVDGYAINGRDFFMPYLKLVQSASKEPRYRDRARPDVVEVQRDQAPLALEALRRVADIPSFPFAKEARSAFRKLAFDLDAGAFADHQSAVLYLDRNSNEDMRDRLRTLADAVIARKRISFTYHGMYRGESTERDVHGYGLLFQGANWYLVGPDAKASDVRLFRVSRMDDVRVNERSPNTPDYEVPEEFAMERFAKREAWDLGEDTHAMVAHVLFHFPMSVWADRNEHGTLIEQRADGSHVRSFHVQQVNPFVRWVLGMAGDAEILEPEQLRSEYRRMAERVIAAHRGVDVSH